MSSSQNSNLYYYLALAGTLPFIATAVALILGKESIPFLGDARHVQATYGLLICSFMAGSQWGQHLKRDDKWRRFLPIFTNVIVLLVWFSYLILSQTSFVVVLALAFIALYWVDSEFEKDGGITKHYLSIRAYVTAVVVASLLLSLPF